MTKNTRDLITPICVHHSVRNDFVDRVRKYPFGVDKHIIIIMTTTTTTTSRRRALRRAREILNLSSSFGDDDDDDDDEYYYCKASIDRAFRKHALRAHPDKKNGSAKAFNE